MNIDFWGIVSKIRSILFVLCAAIVLTTCQTVQTVLQKPIVSLHSVELAGINFNGIQLLSKIKVENPNSINLPLPEVDWELFLNANSFVSGIVKLDQRVGARDSTFIDIPVNLDFLGIFNTFTSLIGRVQSDYKIALGVKFNIPVLGEMLWNFEHDGVVPMLQAPKLTMPSMGIQSINLSGVVFAVSVNVENPNAFELPAPNVAYDFLVNRNSFLKSTVETKPLAASSVTPVVFSFAVNYTDLFSSISNLSSLGNVPSLLNLSFDFGVPAFVSDIVNLQIPGTLPLTGRI